MDDFKQINDSHGHAAGDTVILEIAQRIETCVRTDDLVARYGGDEFVAALTAIHGIDDARAVAAKIQLGVLTPIRLNSHTIQVTVSIGVALAEPGDTLDDVLHRADRALYAAKEAGRGRTMTAAQVRAMGSSDADLVNKFRSG